MPRRSLRWREQHHPRPDGNPSPKAIHKIQFGFGMGDQFGVDGGANYQATIGSAVVRTSETAEARQRNLNLSDEVREIAWKAQCRLHKRYTKLTASGKNKNQTVTAVGRELLGFIWHIAVKTERSLEQTKAA